MSEKLRLTIDVDTDIRWSTIVTLVEQALEEVMGDEMSEQVVRFVIEVREPEVEAADE